MSTTRLELDEQQRQAVLTALCYPTAVFDRLPGHQIRPGVVADVTRILERLRPTDAELGGRRFILSNVARKHVAVLVKAPLMVEADDD